MALVPSLIDVPFEGGLDTNTDKKKVIPAKLLELDNAVFTGSSIEFRPGGSFLADGVAAGGPALSSARALSVVGGELLRWTKDGVYGRSSASAPWVKRADAVDANPLAYDVQPIVQRPRSCTMFDAASLFGVTVYTWVEAEASTRVLRATVVDEATGVRHQDAVALATLVPFSSNDLVYPRVIACGACLVVAYVEGTSTTAANIRVRALSPSRPTGFSTAATIANAKIRTGTFSGPVALAVADLTPAGAGTGTTGRLAVSYSAVANGIATAQYTVSPTGVVTLATPAAVTVGPSGGSSADDYGSVHLHVNAARTRLFLVFRNRGNNKVELRTFDPSTHATVASGVYLGDAGSAFRITFVEATPGAHRAYIEVQSTASEPLYAAAFADAGTATSTAAVLVRGLRLGGGAFVLGGRTYLPCLYQNMWGTADAPGVQPTFFLFDVAASRVVLRALVGQAGGPLDVAPILARPFVSDSEVSLVVPVRVRVEFEEASGILLDTTAIGLSRLSVTAADPAALDRAEEQEALHVGGAAAAYYDGATWAEEGFHVAPEGVVVTLAAGAVLSAGTYSWVVCYEWTDARGRLHRSAPSTPVTATSIGGQVATITVPYLHLTGKAGVRLALYRTQADGVVFYRALRSTATTIQPNAITGNTATIQDTTTDLNLRDNEVLPYGGASGGSVGGELWHRPPRGYSVAHKHQEYLLTTVMDDPYTVAYTLPLTKGEGPAWADELRLNVPSAQGPVVALATLDDKLVILCERGAWAVLGRGPTRDGGNNGFSEPQYITGSVGCLSAASVVSSPDGLMYQSPNGIYLLSRSLETVKLGAGVQEYSGQTVARALDVPARRELRWYTQEGRTLVYSLEWRQWSTWTEQPTRDALLFQDVVHYADGSRVRYEDAASILEGGAPFSMVVGTSWLKWAGFSGLQRVWKALLVGTAGVTCTLRSDVFYDYEDVTPGQTKEETFPGRSVGGPPALRVRQTLKQQLCNNLRFRWTLTPAPTGPTDAGKLGLTSLTLEFGAHRGTAKRRVSSL